MEHKHGKGCGHSQIQHGDHLDWLVEGQGDHLDLHHLHGSHCDYHGSVIKSNSKGKTDGNQKEETLLVRRKTMEIWPIVEPIPWYKSRDDKRFIIMLFLTGSFFFVEIIYGLSVGSLALVADAMHMLSDIIALCVGFYSLRVSRRQKTEKFTYGMTRMEVVGGLINSSFLLALCFSIVTEAVHRLIDGVDPNSDLESKGDTIILVGFIGLGVNLLGLVIFGHGGHSHGGHGHSHGKHGDHEAEAFHELDEEHAHRKHAHGGCFGCHCGRGMSLNVQGVFLHVLGDALGSVAAIVSGFIISETAWSKRVLADPICSLVISALIICTAWPLLRKCASMLLQQVPHHLDFSTLQTRLLQVNGVLEIHDFHIWQLSPEKIVTSLHVILYKGSNFMAISDEMKLLLHSYGIHSTTIQPEYVSRGETQNAIEENCHEPICDEQKCAPKHCCAPSQ